MIIKVDSEVIAEIRNALTVIQLNAESIFRRLKYIRDEKAPEEIVKQVKRIDSLLPPVKFEG